MLEEPENKLLSCISAPVSQVLAFVEAGSETSAHPVKVILTKMMETK